jgi:predicted nuclease of predicted toxin-antitoxin system
MRILANENIPADAIRLLQLRGHDVAWVRTDAPGTPDAENLLRSVAEQRVMITLDKDFGELVFRMGQEASCGVVLFRMRPQSPGLVAERIADVLASRDDWRGFFSVADERHVRMVALPGRSSKKPR